MLVDLRPKASPATTPRGARARLITCNKNGIPFDPEKPTVTSGIRVGSPAGTTRGFGRRVHIADMIADVLEGLRTKGEAAIRQSRPTSATASQPCAPASRSTRGKIGCAARSAVMTTAR
jgi:glycine hydroxymethyltransferase